MEQIKQRVSQNKFLTDVAGLLESYEEPQQMQIMGRNVLKRDIHLKLEGDQVIRVALWGSIVDEFSTFFQTDEIGPFVIVVEGATAKTYQGTPYLSTIPSSRIHNRIHITETLMIKQRHSDYNDSFAALLAKRGHSTSAIKVERTTIQGLKDMDFNPIYEDKTFTVLAKIVEIKQTFGWQYVACERCFKKVKQQSDKYYCPDCDTHSSYPHRRYKLDLQVEDETTTTTYVVFDREAEKLLQISAESLFNESSENSDATPVRIHSLHGNIDIFKIKFTKYNIQLARENYSVMTVSGPTEEETKRLQPKQVCHIYLQSYKIRCHSFMKNNYKNFKLFLAQIERFTNISIILGLRTNGGRHNGHHSCISKITIKAFKKEEKPLTKAARKQTKNMILLITFFICALIFHLH